MSAAKSISGSVEWTEFVDDYDWLRLTFAVCYDADLGCEPVIDHECGSSPGEGTSVEITRVELQTLRLDLGDGLPTLEVQRHQLDEHWRNKVEERLMLSDPDHPIHTLCVADAERHR